eukprot:Seg873.16 transcript_id=Seg873.16/GoldUCD/mRNA.D3Y31 product="Mitogen-activated protein kinase kinase kinase 1" protein_id=Seg873.16/GoldUCD/D3Y31
MKQLHKKSADSNIKELQHDVAEMSQQNEKLRQFLRNLQSKSKMHHPVSNFAKPVSRADQVKQSKLAVLKLLPHEPPQFVDSDVMQGSQIGNGVFGGVTVAKILSMGSILVAAKTIKLDQSSLLDVQAERRIMQALSGHSLFPYCFGFIKPNIILMQLIGNASLSSHPSVLTIHNQMKNTILNSCDWINVSTQVVRGISYLHQLLLLHNDIKSDNVILDPTTKRAVIIDFGKATTIEYPLTYCLNEEQREKYNKHHRHLAHELRNAAGTQQSVMTDTYSIGYLIKYIGYYTKHDELYNIGRRMKASNVCERMNLKTAYYLLSKLS